MTHLYIEQNTGSTEEVTSAIISKLYELAISGDLDNTSDLKGRLHSPYAYDTHINYLNGNFDDLYITATKEYILFEDPEVERVLVALTGAYAVSSDGIGVTTQDAALCTEIPEYAFYQNTSVTSFNDLSKFGSVALGQNCFNGATNLRSIYLNNVTEFKGIRTFLGCSNLSIEVDMPYVTGWMIAAFSGTAITKVKNLGSVTQLNAAYGVGCFASCKSLTQVVLPTTCVRLDESTFKECDHLVDVHPVSYVETVRGGSFSTTGTLGILNFANATQVEAPFCAGSGQSNVRTTVRQAYFPNIQTIQTNGYYGNSAYYHYGQWDDIVTDLLYIKGTFSFYGASFVNSVINSLVIDIDTPPAILNVGGREDSQMDEYESGANKGRASRLFDYSTISNIYVPDSAVNTYKSTAIWSDKASIIKPISELTKVSTEEDLQSGQIALIEAYMGTTSNS